MLISHRHLPLCPTPCTTHHAGHVFLTLPTPVTQRQTCQKEGSKMLNTHWTPVDKSVPSQQHSNTHRALWDCFLVDPAWQRLTGTGHADSRRPVLKRKWSHRTRRGTTHALNTSVFVFTPAETQHRASGLARQLSFGTTRICHPALLRNVCYYNRLSVFKAFIFLSHSIIFSLRLSHFVSFFFLVYSYPTEVFPDFITAGTQSRWWRIIGNIKLLWLLAGQLRWIFWLWGLISPYLCWVSSREASGECRSVMWEQFGPETNVVSLLNVTRPLSQGPAGNREVLRPRQAASQAIQTIPHYTTPHSFTRSLPHLFFSCSLLGSEVMLFA